MDEIIHGAISALFFAVGAGAIVFGAAHVSPPAGWIVFGLFCLFLAAWPVIRRS